jgi:hypothetical protein
MKLLGTPFNGVFTGSSSIVDTGVPGSSGSANDFSESIAGLNEGLFYHWRVRTLSADPFFPRSPWISLAGNNSSETKLRTAGCIDRDGDGYGALSDSSCLSLVPDCNDNEAASWYTPGETAKLRFTSKTVLSWDAPTAPGGLSSGLLYDTLRSGQASYFLAATCVESDDGPNTTATDPSIPSNGQAFFYLTRAQNGCPLGSGSLGTTSAGAPRGGSACP